MELNEFECPNCGASHMAVAEDGRLNCQFCDSEFGEVTRICPQCGQYNAPQVRHCAECGARLLRDCPACGADNWALAEHCVECGRNLDLVERMTLRWQKTTQERLYAQQAGMSALKAEEERASQERMAGFMEIERIRQEAIVRAEEERRQRDRQLMSWVGVLAVVVFVIMVILVVWAAVGG